jgi:hypothetical protein
VEIRKISDGSGLLRCTRRDGTECWQKQRRHGIHFAFHDLTHFAVETVLGYRDGFFSLLAQGWEMEDTTGKGARGPLPPGALEVETLVGTLDAERASGALLTAAEFNELAALQASNGGRPVPRCLSDTEIQAVRKRLSELFREWQKVKDGSELVLELQEDENHGDAIVLRAIGQTGQRVRS